MNFEDTILLLRDLLQDPEGYIWDDEELSEYINDAQLEYVTRSKCLKKSSDFLPDENGNFYFNDDFIKLEFAYNERAMELGQVNQHDLRHEYGNAVDSTTGRPEYIYDGSGSNEFCLYPDPAINAEPLALDQETGTLVGFDGIDIAFNQETGIVASIGDVSFDQDDGVIYAANQHEDIGGKIHYVRAPYQNTIEVRIPEALVFLAAALCLSDEGENQNLQLADGFKGIFNTMIGIENNYNHKQHGHKRGRGLL